MITLSVVNRDRQVNISVSEAEYNAIQEEAESLGLRTAAYIRMILLHQVKLAKAASKTESEYLDPFKPKTYKP